MRSTPLHPRSRGGGGFTLVELLLAITLLAGLMAAAIFGFSSLQRSAQLNEGVERVETAMRFARAHAANTGRKVQIVVTTSEAAAASSASASSSSSSGDSRSDSPGLAADALHSLSILWEADPAGAPGVFEPIPSLSGDVSDVSELVEIRSVGRESKGDKSSEAGFQDNGSTEDSGSSSWPTGTAVANSPYSPNPTESTNPTDPSSELSTEMGAPLGGSNRSVREANPGESTITFYPDGSCDGATIVLASRDSDDVREVAVHLESVTGTTRRLWRASAGSTSAEPTAGGATDPGSPASGATPRSANGSAVTTTAPLKARR